MSHKLRIILEFFSLKSAEEQEYSAWAGKTTFLFKKKRVKLKCFLSFQMFYALIDPRNDVFTSFLWSKRV